MAPIELTFFVCVGIFGLIGIIRGYPRDLGNTFTFLLLVFIFTLIDSNGGSTSNLYPSYQEFFDAKSVSSLILILIMLFTGVIWGTSGYPKILGNVLLLLALIFLLNFVDNDKRVLGALSEQFFAVTGQKSENITRTLIIQTGFIIIVFGSYFNSMFDLTGNQLFPPLGTLISLLVGLLNGYLVGGTLWYYLDKFHYAYIPEFDPTLTVEGGRLLNFLPQTILPSPFLWLVPLIVLLILRIRGSAPAPIAYE